MNNIAYLNTDNYGANNSINANKSLSRVDNTAECLCIHDVQ